MNVTIEMPDALHPETRKCVAKFAEALAAKLREAEEKYDYDNGWQTCDWAKELPVRLLEHVEKGDPRDVAAYCAFAWSRGWSVAPGATWCFARFLVRSIYRLCSKDKDVASLLSLSDAMPDKIADCVVVIRDDREAAVKLRAWLIASGYLDPKRLVSEAQREGEGRA